MTSPAPPKLTVGQKVWLVENSAATPRYVQIMTVGRKWVHVPGRYSHPATFDRHTLKANVNDDHAYGRLFVAFEDIAVYRAAEEEKRAAETAWREFRRYLPHWCPEHLTAADIARISAEIKGNSACNSTTSTSDEVATASDSQ
jgi:hypothetical protein